MKKFIVIAALLFPTLAFAQVPSRLCINTVPGNVQQCQPVDATNALPVNASGLGLATAQVNVGVTATVTVAARVGRRAVTITNLGALDVFCGTAAVTTQTGDLIAGVKGTAKTYYTGSAISCISSSNEGIAQLMSVAETF